MGRPTAAVSRRLAAIGLLALLVAFGHPARADTGWSGERMPEALVTGAARGDYVHTRDGGAMVYVPAGYFLRGTTKARAAALGRQFGDFFEVETPQRSIYLSAY